jgi:hypothetical protein
MKITISKVVVIVFLFFICAENASANYTYTWVGNTGATGTNWNFSANWTSSPAGGIYPLSTDHVIIPATTYAPTVNVNSACTNITFTGNNTLTISPTITLTVNGILLNSTVAVTVNLAMGSNSKLDQTGGYINNAGTFNVAGGTIQLEAGGPYINNSGIFKANGNCTINGVGNANTSTNSIVNTGTFYVGTSNSICNIILDDSDIIYNQSTGIFYIGSTSVISYFNANAHDAGITNVSGGTFTLQSDSYGSATIGATPPPAQNDIYTGTFNVERYLTGGIGYRNYRLVSSQVYAATISSSYNVYDINYLKNSIYLTGTITTGGFDNIVPANPTLYLYRENLTPAFSTFLNSNFIGISKINNTPTYAYSMNDATYTSTYNIPAGTGYLCFFRGNRSTSFANKTTAPYPIPENTTLTATGSLNAGTITARNWFNAGSTNLSFTTATPAAYQGFNLVGNPYPSTIDWETYQSTNTGIGIYGNNISSTIYLLNPATENYDTYQYGGNHTNNGTRYIASGQAFFVKAACTCSQVTFNESAKVNNLNTGLSLFMGNPANLATNNQYLRLQLAKDSVNSDDILIRFNKGAGTQYDENADAQYLQGFGKVSLASLSSDHVPLAINVLPLPVQSETIGLSVNTTAGGIYRLNMKQLTGIPQLFDIWLMDAYKKDSLDMRHNTTYSFNIYKNDTASLGTKRFSLVIRQNPGYAYHLLGFTAANVPNTTSRVQVLWKTENEQNYTNFTVERSIDSGKTFNVLGGMQGSGGGIYSLLDNSPVAGQNLYRLKQEDINNTITYSQVVPVMYTGISNNLAGSDNVNVYPNPVSNIINLSVVSQKQGAPENYNIMIITNLGLMIQQVTSTQPQWHSNVGSLPSGTYTIQVINNKNGTLIGQTKFVKL